MDYCGIVVLIVSSFGPWVHFGFYCDTSYLKTFYLTAASLCGRAAMVVVAADRFRGGEYRVLRAGEGCICCVMTMGQFRPSQLCSSC